MSERTIELARLEITNPEDPNRPGTKTTLDVEVYYSLGGANFFTGGTDTRGYFLSVSPIARHGEGWKSFLSFSGVKVLLQPANRFSQKVLEQVAATALQSEVYPRLVAYVCEKGKYTLVEGQEHAPQQPELPAAELWGSDAPPPAS